MQHSWPMSIVLHWLTYLNIACWCSIHRFPHCSHIGCTHQVSESGPRSCSIAVLHSWHMQHSWPMSIVLHWLTYLNIACWCSIHRFPHCSHIGCTHQVSESGPRSCSISVLHSWHMQHSWPTSIILYRLTYLNIACWCSIHRFPHCSHIGCTH